MLRPGDLISHFEGIAVDGRRLQYAQLWQHRNLVLFLLPADLRAAARPYFNALEARLATLRPDESLFASATNNIALRYETSGNRRGLHRVHLRSFWAWLAVPALLGAYRGELPMRRRRCARTGKRSSSSVTRSSDFDTSASTACSLTTSAQSCVSKDVDADLKVGGPATARDEWIAEFVQFCDRHDLPADFVSTHHYPTDALITPGTDTEAQLASSRRSIMRQWAQDTRRRACGRPVYYTEWNASSNPRDPRHDEPYAAAFAAKTALEASGVADGYSFWNLSSLLVARLESASRLREDRCAWQYANRAVYLEVDLPPRAVASVAVTFQAV